MSRAKPRIILTFNSYNLSVKHARSIRASVRRGWTGQICINEVPVLLAENKGELQRFNDNAIHLHAVGDSSVARNNSRYCWDQFYHAYSQAHPTISETDLAANLVQTAIFWQKIEIYRPHAVIFRLPNDPQYTFRYMSHQDQPAEIRQIIRQVYPPVIFITES